MMCRPVCLRERERERERKSECYNVVNTHIYTHSFSEGERERVSVYECVYNIILYYTYVYYIGTHAARAPQPPPGCGLYIYSINSHKLHRHYRKVLSRISAYLLHSLLLKIWSHYREHVYTYIYYTGAMHSERHTERDI